MQPILTGISHASMDFGNTDPLPMPMLAAFRLTGELKLKSSKRAGIPAEVPRITGLLVFRGDGDILYAKDNPNTVWLSR